MKLTKEVVEKISSIKGNAEDSNMEIIVRIFHLTQMMILSYMFPIRSGCY